MRKFLLVLLQMLCLSGLMAQERYFRVADISISGNEKTKSQTILREFRYSVGDSITESSLDKEIQNFTDNL